MLKTLRVDDNLLHGQIAFSWVRNLHIHQIMIANDEVVNDEFIKMTLGLSKPNGVELVIVDVDSAIDMLKKDSKKNILVIVKNLKDAKRILDKLTCIDSLNLGLLRSNEEIKLNYESISMTAKDITICEELWKRNIKIEYRLRFTDQSIDLKTIL